MSDNKKIHIISGGTISHIATHLALSAPAYGKTGATLSLMCRDIMPLLDTVLHSTKMSQHSTFGPLDPKTRPQTNEDIQALVDDLVSREDTKIIFMPVALCDFNVSTIQCSHPDKDYSATISDVGKNAKRLSTHGEHQYELHLVPAPKVISTIRKTRKDIFLVGFKTTDGVDEKEQYLAGLGLLKEASCNLVFANDVKTGLCMVITPEEARYHVTKERNDALRGLVEMTHLRSHLTFTRSTVIAGDSIPWNSDSVPSALREVVNHCIKNNAYKPFRGATVGHFAAKLSEDTFITSKRKTNFNDLEKIGLVKIKTDGPDTVFAYGAKPSVGGQSQRIVFSEHPEYDCIVHAHVPKREGSLVPTMSQREFECGSHSCGSNTSNGLRKFGNLSAVYLDQHGPNVVFHSSIDPQEVIDFIEANFDLSQKTGGYVS